MKKAFVLAAILAALFGASSATASAPTGTSVFGAGAVAWPDTPTPGVTTTELGIIAAQVLPSGEPHGTILNLSPLGNTAATVSCIEVVGDTVYVGGQLRAGWDFYMGETFRQIAFGVRDGDPDGDLVAGAIFRRSDIDPCQILSSFRAVFPLQFGNFVVR
jgi:hypothetical protein